MKKATDTTKSVHLSASAGSGKTRALKERCLAILDVLDRRGLNIDQAVAITFTDKAAAEIKERVMNGLPEAMLKKIIRGRQDLRISTIHSFCMNLLKRYPLEAGLPPDFGILDSRDQAAKKQKAIEDALEESDGNQEIMAPLREFSADELAARVLYLLSIRSKLKRLELEAGGSDGLMRVLRANMRIEQAESELNEIVTGAAWRSSFENMEQVLRNQGDHYDACMGKEHLLLAQANAADAARISASLRPVYFTGAGSPRKNPFIPKKAYNGGRAEYERLFVQIQEMLGQFQARHADFIAGQQAASLLRLYLAAEKKYQAAKLREGLLDFDDLEINAYALLRGIDSPDILYWLDRKILHFLVDEFQDTSDIQWAILNKLTEEIFAGQGAEKPVPPTLFVVGDEKQSIYRFREANYRLIENVRTRMEANIPSPAREILTLDRNFRSTREVIETVNEVFGALWGKTYQASGVAREKQEGSVRLIELSAPSDQGSSIPSESSVLAREIKSFTSTGATVYDAGNDGSWNRRPVEYRDCAILIQSRTRLKEYEMALQAEQIPYRVLGGIGFYDEDEIQALMNILFFLWNPDDRLAFAASLKSPLFGLSDGEIYTLVRDQTDMISGFRQKCPDEGNLLLGWMQLKGLVPLATLIHRIIADTGAYVRFGKGNPQAFFNIDKLLDTAREFDRRGYTTLQDFVDWVKNIQATEQREATADMNLPGFHGSVSIMTVHKAKGLEYPVVFLPGMNQQPRSFSNGPLVIVDERKDGIRMAVKDAESPVYNELWEREREELRREHQRLLYVAMTRARDHLVMVGTLKDGSMPIQQNTWLNYLHETAPKPLFDAPSEPEPGVRLFSCPSALPSRTADQPRPPMPEESKKIADAETVFQNLAPVSRMVGWEWKKATDFIDHASIEQHMALQAPAAVSPLTRGTVLHRCLELFTTTGAWDADSVINEHPDIIALPGDVRRRFTDDIRNVMAAVLNHPEHAWIFESNPSAYSELSFLYQKGHALVSGVMDRLVIGKDTGAVIDYKAILIKDDKDLSFWLDHYRPQVRIYCEAARHIFGLTSVKGYLLFLDSNKLVSCLSI